MSVPQFARIRVCLSTAVLLLAVFQTAKSAQNASGHFEVYCDGFGFFLEKVDGAPVPGKVLLFLYTGFPGVQYAYESMQNWSDVIVYRNGCIADGGCEILARGKVRLDNEATVDARRVSGKYEIEFNGKHLSGQFAAKRRGYKHPPRICM
jgi:hypothetical protein